MYSSEWRSGLSSPSGGAPSSAASSSRSKPLEIAVAWAAPRRSWASAAIGRGDRGDAVGGRGQRAVQPGVQRALGRGREVAVVALEAPAVADVGDPGQAQAALEREADQVGRGRRPGGPHDVGALLARDAQRGRQRERDPADEREVGHDDVLQARGRRRGDAGRLRAAGLPQQRVEALLAPVEVGGHHVARAHDARGALDRPAARHLGGDDDDPVAAAPEVLGKAGGAPRGRQRRGRRQVRDEQDGPLHRALR